MRATLKHLHPHLTDGMNPVYGLLTKARETVNREPFTVKELKEACKMNGIKATGDKKALLSALMKI